MAELRADPPALDAAGHNRFDLRVPGYRPLISLAVLSLLFQGATR
jgi:hypothetical protein